MSGKELIEQAKKDVAAKKKAERQPKTIKVSTLIKTTIASLILLSVGAFAGIKINNQINSTIETQVNQKVEATLKTLK